MKKINKNFLIKIFFITTTLCINLTNCNKLGNKSIEYFQKDPQYIVIPANDVTLSLTMKCEENERIHICKNGKIENTEEFLSNLTDYVSKVSILKINNLTGEQIITSKEKLYRNYRIVQNNNYATATEDYLQLNKFFYDHLFKGYSKLNLNDMKKYTHYYNNELCDKYKSKPDDDEYKFCQEMINKCKDCFKNYQPDHYFIVSEPDQKYTSYFVFKRYNYE